MSDQHQRNNPPTDADRSPASSISGGLVTYVATASLVLSGVSLAIYALAAFTEPDWTVAGPGLLVAAAGIAGLRNRWFYLAGLVPMGAILSIAGPILAYDLARPTERSYFIGTVMIIVGGCLAAVFAVVAAFTSTRRAFAFGAVGAAGSIPIVIWVVVAGSPASAAMGDSITTAERASAVHVEMVDYAFAADRASLIGNQVIHLRNTGTLPHDFTIAALDVAVFVPPGRETYVRLPDIGSSPVRVICTVGDHEALGMQLDLTPAVP